MNKSLLSLLLVFFCVIAPHTHAGFDKGGKITAVIPSYMPDLIRIRMDVALDDPGVGNCQAGSWINIYGRGADQEAKREYLKSHYSAVLMAMTAGMRVRVLGQHTSGGVCNIEDMQIFNN